MLWTFISLVWRRKWRQKSYWNDFPHKKRTVKHITTSEWWCWKIAMFTDAVDAREPFYCCWWCWILWTETKMSTTLSAASKALNIFYMAALCSLVLFLFCFFVSFRISTSPGFTGKLTRNDYFHIQFSLNWIWFAELFFYNLVSFYRIVIAFVQ